MKKSDQKGEDILAVSMLDSAVARRVLRLVIIGVLTLFRRTVYMLCRLKGQN
jgi:hypothetical protein